MFMHQHNKRTVVPILQRENSEGKKGKISISISGTAGKGYRKEKEGANGLWKGSADIFLWKTVFSFPILCSF